MKWAAGLLERSSSSSTHSSPLVRRGTSRRRSYSFSDVVNSHTHNADDGIDFSLSSPLPPHLLHKSLTLDREEEKEGIEVGGMEDQEAEGLLHISKRSDFVRTAVLLSTPSSSALSPSSSLFNISREEKKSKNRGEKRAASPQRNEGRSISSDSNEESLLQRDELSSKESKDFARSKSKESHDDFHEAVADLEELQWLNRNLQLENRQLNLEIARLTSQSEEAAELVSELQLRLAEEAHHREIIVLKAAEETAILEAKIDLAERSLCTFEGKLQGVAAETLNKNIVLERWMEGLLLYAGLEVNPMQFIEILSSGCESNELAADEVNASRVAAMIEDRFGGSFKNRGSQNGSELPSSKIEDLAEAHATIALLRKGHYLKELEEEGVFNAFSMDERELHRRRASQETLASENEPDCLSLEEKVKDLMQQLTRKEALYQEILRECDAVTVEAVHWEEKYLLHTDEAMKASETIRALQEKLQQVHGIMTDQDEVVEELCEEIEERKDELELAKAQMEELQSSLMFTTKKYEDDVRVWAEEAHRAQCAMALLQDEKASLQIQITCLNESEASLRKELHNLRVHHDVNDNNLMKQNENLNFRITELQEEMKVSKLEILKLRLELQVCDGEMVSKLNARILSLREELDNNMSLINRAGSAIRERDEKYRLLLNVVEQKDDAISRLVKQLEALQSSQAQHVQIESDLSHGGAISGDGHQCFHGEMGSRTNEELRAARLQLEEERERRKQLEVTVSMLGASLASAEEDIVNDNHLLEFANKDLINMNEALLSLQQELTSYKSKLFEAQESSNQAVDVLLTVKKEAEEWMTRCLAAEEQAAIQYDLIYQLRESRTNEEDLKNDMNSLHNDYIEVKEERDRLELILSSLQRELQYEKELNLETLEEIRSKTTQSDVQLLEIERLKDELASEVEEIGRLNGLLQDADDLRVVMKDVNEGINKKLIEVKARHESLKASLRSERVEKASIQHLFEESQAMLTSAQRQHDLLLREQADSYETKLTTMALALSSAQETVVKLQSQLKDYCELEAELVNVQDQLIEARELCDLFREQITEAVHKSREEEESRESLGSDLANLRANVTLLILQKEQSDAELCDLRNALAAERTKAEDLLFGRSQDADLIAELRYELTASELARADIECEVVELRNGRGEQLLLSKQLSDARETEVQAQEQHVVTLTAEADHVQEISRQHYEKQMADLRDELRVVQVELAATQEENLAGYQMHEEFQDHITEERKLKTSLSEEVVRLRDTSMRLACDLQDTQVELESERQVSEASQMQLNAAKNEIYAHKKDIARLEVLLVREKRLLSESQRALRRVTTNADRHSEMVASHDLGGHFTTTIASLQHPCTYGPATVASEDSFIVSEISDVNTPGEMKEAVFRLSFPRVARVRSRSTPTTTPPCGSPVMIERKKNVLSSASTAAP